MKKTVLKVLCGVMILMGTACTNTTQEELSDVYMTINTRPAGIYLWSLTKIKNNSYGWKKNNGS